MTWFEWVYYSLQWVMAPHYLWARKTLQRLCQGDRRKQMIDIGGRKSPYTIGVDCEVHIIDLPRESEVQQSLSLGLTDQMLAELRGRRSNIKSVRLEDITRTLLPGNSFDAAVSVEVIEHVPDDSAFVRQIYRLLKPGGFLVLTTPNGEAVPNVNPDHVRHYRGKELESKLRECFEEVDVRYGIRQGYLQRVSLQCWVPARGHRLRIFKAPWIMFCTLVLNLREDWNCRVGAGKNQLYAIARKAGDGA